MKSKRIKSLVLAITGSLALGCLPGCFGNGCARNTGSPPHTESKEVVTGQQPTNSIISDFPLLNFEAISPENKSAFIKLLNDEICPCGCPKTFAQCLVNNNDCAPGFMLAQWALAQLKNGTSPRSLFAATSEEINAGFSSKPADIKKIGAHRKGKVASAITIVEFADFECPACKVAARAVADLFKEKGSEIELYFMHFPLNSHPHAERAAIYAEAAARQGKFWEMHDMLFAHEGPLNEMDLLSIASKIFKDSKAHAQFIRDTKDQELLKKVRADKEYATKELNLQGTPSFFINGRLYNLSLAKDGFLTRINMEKERNNSSCVGKS